MSAAVELVDTNVHKSLPELVDDSLRFTGQASSEVHDKSLNVAAFYHNDFEERESMRGVHIMERNGRGRRVAFLMD